MTDIVLTKRPPAAAGGKRIVPVRLSDSRSGGIPSPNGDAPSVPTCAPRAAAASVLHGRDLRLRRAEVTPSGPA